MTVHHDWQSGQELAVTITCAVTTAKDVDICDVGAVADRVNTDALNALFAPATPGGTRAW